MRLEREGGRRSHGSESTNPARIWSKKGPGSTGTVSQFHGSTAWEARVHRASVGAPSVAARRLSAASLVGPLRGATQCARRRAGGPRAGASGVRARDAGRTPSAETSPLRQDLGGGRRIRSESREGRRRSRLSHPQRQTQRATPKAPRRLGVLLRLGSDNGRAYTEPGTDRAEEGQTARDQKIGNLNLRVT